LSPMRMSSLGKVRQLSSSDRRLLFRSLLLLPAIHTALLVVGYSRLRTALVRIVSLGHEKLPSSELEIMDEAQRIVQIVDLAARHGIYKASCLRKSILVWWFLQEEGIQSRICFGVRLVGQNLEGHAWVESSGVIVNDSADTCARYKPMYEVLPSTELGL
jgi:hypothetical protein